ncbi:MAG: hypothetical protein Q4P06_03245 [Actinomycetaceae bacterium]|nr:hypothetical protein [Actinomycetaceae bacterium]
MVEDGARHVLVHYSPNAEEAGNDQPRVWERRVHQRAKEYGATHPRVCGIGAPALPWRHTPQQKPGRGGRLQNVGRVTASRS